MRHRWSALAMPAGRVASVAAILAAVSVSAFPSAASARPPSGVTVDDTIVVAVAPREPGPCVSTVFAGVTIVMSRARLDAIAASAGRRWRNEAERLRRIAGDRAKALIAAATGATDRYGCAVVPPDDLHDALYLVGDLLERGEVTVFRAGEAKPERTVQVRYLAFRCGPTCGRGDILFELADDEGSKPFIALPWWVA